MAQYLLMRLYGPLASWGEIAVGEARHCAMHPSRSALLGLLAAALGIERENDTALSALSQGYRLGIKLEAPGSLLRDFHTIQLGVPGRKQRFRSRRQSLSAEKIDTLLSMREYRCDSIASIALEATEHAPFTLDELAEALRAPRFTLYLGRKSCPLALPIAPQIVEAPSLRAAFDQASRRSLMALLGSEPDRAWPIEADRRVFGRAQPRYFWDDGMVPGMAASLQTVRYDQPLSRRRWQFVPRREHVHIERGQQ
ncbi:type I-E CRISPR-associated protein Cas5/CasD [Orrella sp. JC864]|uniref:type I-E CRISPR-associated protein Cas5/CasD n=1 Tax=Orrella sp. JC864 TaxID=3120298 RepID=UPI003008695B